MKAPSYDNCKHIQVGKVGVTVLACTMCDAEHTAWCKSQPWYVRLDEWQHEAIPGFPQWLWRCWRAAWQPFCAFRDWAGDRSIKEAA